jgi:hypothetical protein
MRWWRTPKDDTLPLLAFALQRHLDLISSEPVVDTTPIKLDDGYLLIARAGFTKRTHLSESGTKW